MIGNFDFSKLNNYNQLYNAIKSKKNCSVFGMGYTQKLLSATMCAYNCLYVTADESTAKNVFNELNLICGDRVCLFPTGTDCVLYKRAQNNENNILRIKSIFNIVKGKSKIIVAPISALMCFLPNKKKFIENIVNLKTNSTIEIDYLKMQLTKMGYSLSDLVSGAGQFSVRGDVVDVFPINTEKPYRIEFFDNLIESIKTFDPSTYTVGNAVREVEVCPYTNLLLNSEEIKKITSKIEKLKLTKMNSRDSECRLEGILDEIKLKLDNLDCSFSMDFVFPLVSQDLGTIFDYVSSDTLICFDECKMIYDSLVSTYQNIEERKQMLLESGEALPVKETGYLTKAKLFSFFDNFTKLAHQKITNANKLFNPDCVFKFRFAPIIKYSNNFNSFVDDYTNWIMDGYKCFIFAGDQNEAERLCRKLEKNDIYLSVNKMVGFDTASAILPLHLGMGFVLPDEKIVIVGTNDILPKKAVEPIKVKNPVMSVPEIGSYVVHRFHGIGKCEGITRLTGSFGTKDFVVVLYNGGDKLYVPIDQMDQLDKYSGGDPKRLSKIGGSDFGAVKERVKKQLKEMAFSLLKLYAERESKAGYIYAKDDELQSEFERKFIYTETEDQLSAIQDVKKDMESGKVMDRLVCGDVGFGKTEVALRTAFKTIVNGKQVAFVAPTTILARQHYNTCIERMSEFGIRIAVLDRFVTPKETKEILKKLSEHKIDLLCGTHKILGANVVFDDLGLVILDEEQKFGVEHKEKLKLEQKNINCLTLSATPIPRTLHMSLSGIRDISVISTPPRKRIPTETYVTEYSDALLKSVVQRELNRDGQTFIVYNRVETIYAFSEHVRSLIPNANIVVAHGQLSGNELEDVIYKFFNHKADVLICTTIIENGIDLPNANSLIVIDSDKLGLSQLYQIRGRVGRGTRAGYAYLTYKPQKSLSEDGYKRLDAISEFTEFGSGFKVAMRDLEIRGSGNIFGAEQHGHIEKVGYELYSKMLKNAILELKGKPVDDDNDVQIKVNLDAFIPEAYIVGAEERMVIYKNISSISSEVEKYQMEKDLINRFGDLPAPIKNLINIAFLKSQVKRLGVIEVFMNEKIMKLTFANNDIIMNNKYINKAISEIKEKPVLNLGTMATITFNNLKNNAEANFSTLTQFVLMCNSKK